MAIPPLVEPSAPLSAAEVERYARHVLIPDVGMEGQRRLKNARVLVVGAGGLGSPALMYLAAAGVGTIGVVDDDLVEMSNLQRQVVHGVADVGRLKSESAAETLASLNPLVQVIRHDVRIDSANALEIIADYDLVLDGTDNFPTRYLLSDACVLLGKPDVWGSIFRFDGQASVWWAQHGPCYRCVFPEPPPPGLVPSCAEGGVLGLLCAAIGSIQAAEAVKLIVGIGDPLIGRLMVHDALRQSWDALTVRKDPDCAVCGTSPTVTKLVDYQDFCGMTGGSVRAAASIPVPLISAQELADLLDDSVASPRVLLVDVRGRDERAIAGIPGAQTIHLDEFRSGAAVSQIPFERPVVIMCRSGSRSEEASRILIQAGHPDVRNLAGGVLAWIRDVDPSQPSY
ncbi:MAG TPA: molybdopterin-synthase adenylyltransferase MoeB [Dermatophilaceae bacterium]|nr:molybdopterin-synthase adenylyltransferase MoeB [Dermatophilaceae bacterium]